MAHKIDQTTLKTLVHYDPETGIFTRLKNGKRAGFDVAPSHRYRKLSFGGGYTCVDYEHRWAWLYMTGSLPPHGMVIDHINGIGTDSRWLNIRLVDRCQNSWNCKLSSNNKSGRAGVFWERKTSRWGVRMMVRGKMKYFGAYDDVEVAKEVRRAAEERYRGAVNQRQ